MNISELQAAANNGDIDKIYGMLDADLPTDAERKRLEEIALQQIDVNPEVSVAVTLGTSEEFGREIYLKLLLKDQFSALKSMREGEIPGADTPFSEDLLMIAENCSPEIWGWATEGYGRLEQEIAQLIGDAALIAAEKNPKLYENLKSAEWKWDKADGNDMTGGVCILAAIHSKPEVFEKILGAYDASQADCAVAAAENGRHDNLEVLEKKGYDLTGHPLDSSNGTLLDIATLNTQQETAAWLESRGVRRDF